MTKIIRLVFFTMLILELMIISSITQFLICNSMLRIRKIQSLTTVVVNEQTEHIVRK